MSTKNFAVAVASLGLAMSGFAVAAPTIGKDCPTATATLRAALARIDTSPQATHWMGQDFRIVSETIGLSGAGDDLALTQEQVALVDKVRVVNTAKVGLNDSNALPDADLPMIVETSLDSSQPIVRLSCPKASVSCYLRSRGADGVNEDSPGGGMVLRVRTKADGEQLIRAILGATARCIDPRPPER